MDSAHIAKIFIILDEYFIHLERPPHAATVEQIFADTKSRDSNLRITCPLLNGSLELEFNSNSIWMRYIKQGENRSQDNFSRSMPKNDFDIIRRILRKIIVLDAASKPAPTPEDPLATVRSSMGGTFG